MPDEPLKKRFTQKASYGFAAGILAMQFGLTMAGKMTGAEFNSGVLMGPVAIVATLAGFGWAIKKARA